MNLTIFGATGGIGKELVKQALDAGHSVTAVSRTVDGVDPRARTVLTAITAPDTELLDSALRGSDAALSGLGPRKISDAGIASLATRNIIASMQRTGMKRLIVVSASPIGTVPSPAIPHPPKHDPGDGFFIRHVAFRIIKAIFKKPYADLALMEDDLRASALDWTILRPPQLTNGALTGMYRTALGINIRGGTKISRADCAHAMLALLNKPESIRRTVGIGS